ncbi:hypothetical protein DP49_5310 [Burkholderia pseudomallei]|nr:hypothetical protein DO73_4637 [Burkholderia pseudomallei]KGD58113.1 hypothetical protein DP49_5310 [Burkholderia pseudomallei]
MCKRLSPMRKWMREPLAQQQTAQSSTYLRPPSEHSIWF